MQDLTFRTFGEYVDVVGRNAPHAVVLDCWRRLDLALRDYFQSLGEKPLLTRRGEERRIAHDLQLGPEVASALSQLRRFRNAIAHEQIMLATSDAAAYATAALRIIGKLALRQLGPPSASCEGSNPGSSTPSEVG
jgi:hypothetical protein